MEGIAELFAELDGYDRYDKDLEVWVTNRIAARREWQRTYSRGPEHKVQKAEYFKRRYWSDPVYRAYKKAQMLERYRERTGRTPRAPAEHGEQRKYAAGCRCVTCNEANNQYQRARRARMKQAA
jgi:hypothetical protein